MYSHIFSAGIRHLARMIGNRDEKVIREFGKKLKAIRLAKKWSLRTLALEAGMDHGTIRLIEGGKSNPTLSTIVVLARALGESPADLMPEK